MSIFEPSQLLIKTESEHEALSKVDLFNKRQHSRKQGNRIKIFVAVSASNHYPNLPFAA